MRFLSPSEKKGPRAVSLLSKFGRHRRVHCTNPFAAGNTSNGIATLRRRSPKTTQAMTKSHNKVMPVLVPSISQLRTESKAPASR